MKKFKTDVFTPKQSPFVLGFWLTISLALLVLSGANYAAIASSQQKLFGEISITLPALLGNTIIPILFCWIDFLPIVPIFLAKEKLVKSKTTDTLVKIWLAVATVNTLVIYAAKGNIALFLLAVRVGFTIVTCFYSIRIAQMRGEKEEITTFGNDG